MSTYMFNEYNPSKYQKCIKNKTISPTFRLSMLYKTEEFREDITDYLILGNGSLSINYNQGQRRSLSFSLNNSDGRFTPSETSGIWLDTKFKLELGIRLSNGDIIYNSAGIFVISSPQAKHSLSEAVIELTCVDKFALLDGTLGGTLETTYLINEGTNIKRAMQSMLSLDNGNGVPVDVKPIMFDTTYSQAKTTYMLTKDANDSIGNMLIDLANMISCDIWYGENGNLIVRSGVQNVSHVTKPVLWEYDSEDAEYLNSTTTYEFSKVKNSVTVVGANANGENVYVATAENTNPFSPTRVSKIGRRVSYIADSNIYSLDLANQRARYELNKISILENTITIESTYMIHLDVNNCISLTDPNLVFSDERFIIQSISVPLSVDSKISIQCTNIATLPYYT